MKTTALVILGIVALIGLGWALTANDLQLARYFSPRYEAVRRETFEQSKAYRQGQTQELQNMQFQYEQASPEHRDALKKIILHRAADFPSEAMPRDLAAFIQSLKHQPENP